MNKEYKIKLDLNKKIYNKKMTFNQFDENVNDFYIEVTKNNEVVKDLDKSIVILVAIKPNNTVDAQFIEVKEGQIYADLKPSMCDLVGNYQAKAMIVLEGEIVTTDTINYSVNEDKIISRLNDDIVSDERFTLFTDALARLSTIESSEEQRIVNEAERILSEENRKIEEAKRVEAELIRQHEEADRTKYDAIRESNENIRKQNESIRLANETNRIDEEAKRVEEENKRKLAEEERNANYNFMTEDEERRRSEANAHKEAEVLRVQAETNRVNEEAKRRTTEQARVSAENTRVSNENVREANEVVRKNNENQRVEAETQRQNRYNSFIADAEANANNFENYTNTAKVKEEERKSNELDRKSQEDRRVSNEVERISNENTRKANEEAREENETSRQNIFENKVDEVDKKIIEINTTKDNFISSVNTKVDTKISELNTTKDNFVSSINTKVDNKISEIEVAKSDMTNTVSNKVNEVETRFNALTSSQQQDAEVIDARDGETSLKARLDRDIEKAKQVYVNVEGSNISTDSSIGYAKDVEILGNTIQDASNLADIRSVGDKVEGQELYEIPVVSRGKNLFDGEVVNGRIINATNSDFMIITDKVGYSSKNLIKLKPNTSYRISRHETAPNYIVFYSYNKKVTRYVPHSEFTGTLENEYYCGFYSVAETKTLKNVQLEEGTVATPYEPYVEDKLTILSPVQLEKVGDVADRIIEKDGVWGVEKNIVDEVVTCVQSSSIISVSDTVDGVILTGSRQDIRYDNNVNNIVLEGKLWTDRSIPITTNNVYSNTVNHIVCFEKGTTIEQAKDFLLGKKVKYQLATPQFIPLPHDQQVKLRTFASKTNISFGCEIEGTIKAQVPKSLGATVNTHTEQINNLNKELDRVKKLEESTVSTVTTESDFTTVEATSNGYFEDVKLEGKTLVNLWGTKSSDFAYSGQASFNPTTQCIEYTSTSNRFSNCFTKNPNQYKVNTVYTLIVNVLENTFESTSNVLKIGSDSGAGSDLGVSRQTINIQGGFVGVKVFTMTTLPDLSNSNIGIRTYIDNVNAEVGAKLKFNIVILEGDHTQNPPSFFEGLKSVGQSASEDGTDEIVVESVNSMCCNNEFELGMIAASNGNLNPQYTDWCSLKDYIKVNANTEYYVCFEGSEELVTEYGAFFYNGNSYLSYSNLSNNGYITTPANANRMKVRYKKKEGVTSNVYNFNLVIAKSKTNYQSDKKRLLYYNEESQSWEKPILRQWDSIEKHADGKYYYHQRSGEVVLNGSESWKQSSDTQEGFARFALWLNDMKVLSDGVNNTFTWISGATFANSTNNETIGSHINSANLYVNILGNRLSTQDVQGFKQWLQANNVTVVYQLAQEKVYECTNIDLITYANETNYVVESGVITPKTTLKVHNNISNVVSLLQKKVSLLESDLTSYMITQNRLMLASRYNADTVSFKVDVASFSDTFEYDNDLYELILNNILVGKDNYNREYIENLIIFYWMDFIISDEMYSTLFEIIEEQHNPKVIEEETPLI